MKNLIRNSLLASKFGLHSSADKVFCISMQRSGTTSVGKFFRDFGFKWAGWPADEKNDWSGSWYDGDYEAIFSSSDFTRSNAFEDSPWFFPGFYKILFNRFPKARFILFARDPDSWFQSMMKHSAGDIIGRTKVHCKVYRRELEYFELLRSGKIDEQAENEIHSKKTMKLADHAQQYKNLYRLHGIEVQEFFRKHSPASLHVGSLEDPNKWQKLGKFLGADVPEGYTSHENASEFTPRPVS
jgi:Sulfotransferase domain